MMVGQLQHVLYFSLDVIAMLLYAWHIGALPVGKSSLAM
jgi:hypothetical protein